jgi:hypothetical protein
VEFVNWKKMKKINTKNITEKVRNRVVKVMKEAEDSKLSATDIDTKLNDLVEALLRLETQARKSLSEDPETLSSVSQRINTAVSALTQLKKKVTIYMDKHGTKEPVKKAKDTSESLKEDVTQDHISQLLSISSEVGSLTKKEFTEYIKDYYDNPEDYGIDEDDEYYKAIEWAILNLDKAYKEVIEAAKNGLQEIDLKVQKFVRLNAKDYEYSEQDSALQIYRSIKKIYPHSVSESKIKTETFNPDKIKGKPQIEILFAEFSNGNTKLDKIKVNGERVSLLELDKFNTLVQKLGATTKLTDNDSDSGFQLKKELSSKGVDVKVGIKTID